MFTWTQAPSGCFTMAGPPLSPKQEPWALAPLVHIMFSVMIPYRALQSSLGRILTWKRSYLGDLSWSFKRNRI